MLKLLFNLRHQSISLTNPGVVVATDSKNYLVAKFNEVSTDWDKPLNAIFTHNKDKIAYTVVVGQTEGLEADECYVPWEVLQNSGEVYVSVFCGSLHTTNIVKFNVVKSGYVEGEIPPPPTPTIYEQFLETLHNKQDVIYIDNTVDAQYNPDGHYQLYYYDEQGIRHNIFDFSPYLGTKDYNALQNRPVVTGRDGSTDVNTVLEGYLNFSSDGFAVSTYQSRDKWIDIGLSPSVPNCWTANYPVERYDFNNITGTFARAGVFRIRYSSAANKPETINDIVGSCFIIQLVSPADNANMIRYIVGENANGQIVTYMQTAELEKIRAFNYAVSEQLVWKKIGEKGDPGATGADGYSPTATVTQTQNGAIVSITDKNGTTTANVSNGTDGNDYILTNQDKSDIANIVLGLLPTTQGVQYGNTGN